MGWQQIEDLAEALFNLRSVSVLSPQAENNIISLWNKLPEAHRGKVDYPPRYKPDSSHTGRFMQKKTASRTQTVTL